MGVACYCSSLLCVALPAQSVIAKSPWTLPALLQHTEPLPLKFFARKAKSVATDLLGCVLLHGTTAGMLVETEAYLGPGDLAAHAAGGVTPRTKILFGPAGHAYVYLIYGMYECLNVVADREGVPGCVLVRALEPLCDLPLMYERRQWHGRPSGLANGPGKLTRALGITREQYGARLDTGPLTIRRWLKQPRFDIETTPRVGISECVDWPLRFLWAGHPCVSKTRPAK